MTERKFGVVFFDDENDPAAGWASVNGGQARRISGPNELATDTLWWSNLSYKAFFLHSEIWRLPWLRHDRYLVVSPRDVMQEWGLDPKSVGSDHAVVVVSTAFARVMALAFRLVRDVEPRARMDEIFTGRLLREDLRRLLPEAEYPKGEAASVMKSGTAWQEITRTTVRGIKGARWVMLRKPRLVHAMEILQTPIPRGPFEFMSRRELSSKTSDRVNWVREADTPCIAEIAIQRIDGEIAPVYGFGNAIEQDKRTPRSWVAHPEFVVLSRFAELDVKSLYVGDSYSVLAPSLPEPIKDFLSDKHSEFSWSAGVIAETLWRAGALGEDKGKQRGFDEERAQTSWQGAWIKSADKSSLFLTSMQLSELGYSVVSYGLGWIRVIVPEETIPDLIKDALTLGLLPLLSDVPQDLFDKNQPVPWGGDKRSRMLAQMMVTGNRNMLWHLDRLPILPADQREAILKRLILDSRNGKL